ncbi:MAG: SMI1/KNR4 family protein [Oscillospiraceae bacterium]|nr:SMI1/KNR4 family protein [Oscillospiraceae bacterium]
MFEGFDFMDFWEESAYSTENYVSEPPTNELIAEIEQELGYKLPESYIWLMKQHNGGVLNWNRDGCKIDWSEGYTEWTNNVVKVSGIMSIGREKTWSICGTDVQCRPDIGVAIATTWDGADVIILDYRECGKDGEPAVVCVDPNARLRITKIADSFESFIRSLRNWDELAAEQEAAKNDHLR